jgi:hypothetical protein
MLFASLWNHKRNCNSKSGIHQWIQWLAGIYKRNISLKGTQNLIWLDDCKNIPNTYILS